MSRLSVAANRDRQPERGAIARGEWRWLLVASSIVLLLASVPTIYAWSVADADHVFTGFVYNTEDGNSYIGKMRLGARGEWLFHIFYTPEPHEHTIVFPLHLLLGKVAAATDLSLVLVYHLARVLFGAGLLLTAYVFVAFFATDATARRIAWILIVLGSGSGWLLMTVGATDWLGSLPIDFWVPEGYVFLVLYNLPHMALAESLLLWSILWTIRSTEFSARHRWLPAGLAAAATTWIVPFYALVLAMGLGVYLLLATVERKMLPWRGIGLAAIAGAFTLPAVLYNAWLFTYNPTFHLWSVQNRNLSPHLLHYVAGYLWLLVPAAWTAMVQMRPGTRAGDGERSLWLNWLPLSWATASLALAYAPFVSQRRLIVLLPFALALPAASALQRWFAQRRWALVAYLTVACLSDLVLVAGSLGPIAQREPPAFRPGAEVAALAWLAGNSQPEETILSSHEVGNVVPAYTDLDVFVGHGPETLNLEAKESAVEQFFSPGTTDAWRRALLADFAIDYVFYGPIESQIGEWNPDTAGFLRPIYRREGYVIYAVEP